MNPPSPRPHTVLTRAALLAAALLLVFAFACAFLVNEAEHVIVLRFGKPLRTVEQPGLHFRLPVPLERLVRIDRRLQHAEIRLSESLTQDQRNVIVPVFFTWRVSDPLLFHTAVRDLEPARQKLDALITSARNTVLGRHEFAHLVGDERAGASIPALEKEILALAAPDAGKQLGIQLVSTGQYRVRLPPYESGAETRGHAIPRRRPRQGRRDEGRD
jgi:membrane protease subunit HflC